MRYKCNVIIGELHWAKKTASNFDVETKRNVSKYIAAGFPSRFVSSIKDKFDNGKNEYIPVVSWERKGFDNSPTISHSKISFAKMFISKLICFTNEKCKLNYVWNARKAL